MRLGQFYIFRMKDNNFWGLPLHFRGSQVVILSYDEDGEWKETIWDKNQFDLSVEVENLDIIPISFMKDNQRRKAVKGVINA